MEVTAQTPSLRVFRKLDLDRVSAEFIEKMEKEEGSAEYVDGDLARDYDWTVEIIAATIGAALVDAEGQVLHEFDGTDAVKHAEAARSSAKITFAIDFDTPVAVEE